MHISLDLALGRLKVLFNSFIREFTGASAAYSLQDLAVGSGSTRVVRVRRSSDNAEDDFAASEVANGTLTTWVGSGNDGFVETWYDQSGNGRDATQSTAGNQPKIVSGGALVLRNGKPTVDFYNNSSFSTSAFTDGSAHSSFAVINNQAANSNRKVFYAKAEFPNKGFVWNYRGDQTAGKYDSVSFDGSTRSLIYNNSSSPLYALVSTFINSSKKLFINGSTAASSSNSFVADDGTLTIGSPSFGTGFDIQEIIIYDSDQTDNRPDIETNINDRYEIY